MFERFTEPARQVVVLGQGEARALKHDYIGTEHILLGLLREEDGLACEVLESLGLTADAVRNAVVRIVGEGKEVPTGQIPFSPKAKKVLELALREALSFGHNYIGTEHILLGLVREGQGAGTRILLEFDADAETIRGAVVAKLDPMTTGAARPRPGFGRRSWFGMRSARVQWEYRIEQREVLDADWLNELGSEGWELIEHSGETFVFKRPCAPPGELRVAG